MQALAMLALAPSEILATPDDDVADTCSNGALSGLVWPFWRVSLELALDDAGSGES